MQRKSRPSGQRASTQPTTERKKSDGKTAKDAADDLVIPVESLTCPILSKILQAFHFAKKAVHARQDGDLAPGSRIIHGKRTACLNTNVDKRIACLHLSVFQAGPPAGRCVCRAQLLSSLPGHCAGNIGACVNLAWQEEGMVLIVAFRSPKDAQAHDLLTTLYDRRRSPLFLANAAPEAEVRPPGPHLIQCACPASPSFREPTTPWQPGHSHCPCMACLSCPRSGVLVLPRCFLGMRCPQ